MTQRERMFCATTDAVAARGYANVTVADIVSGAGVSRRTFYEHFRDKQDCFLAAYADGVGRLVAKIAGEADEHREAGWERRLAAGLEAYTAALAERPKFARTLLIDVLGAGREAVELRGRLYELFVERFADLSAAAAEQDPSIEPVPRIFLRALVGGIGELVQDHMLREGAETLPELTPVLVDLATTVVRHGGVLAPTGPAGSGRAPTA